MEEKNMEAEKVKSVKIYPNPTFGKFSLESHEDILQWELVNQFGSLNLFGLMSPNDSRRTEIDISNFPTGTYFLKVTFKDGTMTRKTVLKD